MMEVKAMELLDDVGRRHPRKNRALLELAELEARIASAEGSEKSALQRELAEKKRKFGDHPYLQELKDFRDREKAFLIAEKGHFAEVLRQAKAEDAELRRLEAEEAQAQAELAFYEPYAELDYDAELACRSARQKLRHLPEIREARSALIEQLKQKEAALAQARQQNSAPLKAEIQKEKTAIQKALSESLKDLKQKKAGGQISAKALHSESRALRLAARDRIALTELKDPVRSLSETIRSLRHHLKVDIKDAREVLNADLADLRRKLPTEKADAFPWKPLLGLPLPGLAQLLQGQSVKALLFFIGALFSYGAALPYALGFGNYRGKGIAGLINLAKGGKRLDRSVIFMIEGIVAIALILLAVGIFYFSFRDSWRVWKKQRQGIRPHNWFETKKELAGNGFPYLVSAPSLLVVLFIVLVPVATTILISFTNYDPKNQSKFFWNGLANYQTIFLGQGVAGKAFWLIVGWTLLWTLFATTLAILIGFFLALLVNQERIRLKKFWRTVYLLPWAVPAFITIMFFSIMLAPDGPLSEVLRQIAGRSIDVKNDTNLARTALIILQGWLGSSYIFLLCTGILQSIPTDLYEAADIDGASRFQQTFHITIPLVLFQIAPLLVTQYTFNFNNYSIIALFNGGGPFFPTKYGNLAGSTDILISYIFKLTIENQYQALGAAITIVVSLILMFVSWLGFRRTKAFSQ